MSDVVVDAPAWSVDLIGRPAFMVADQRVTEIASTRGCGVFTVNEPHREMSDTEVVALPVLGEFLRTWNGSRDVDGHWLGLCPEGAVGGRLTGLVMEGAQVQRVSFEPGQVDARRVVTGRAGEGERSAMAAVLAEALAHERTKQAHESRIARLVEDAHAEADSRDWCGEFDDFLERAGLPRRSRDYLLRVEVTATLYVTHEGVSEDAAIDSLTKQEVFDLLKAEQIDVEAEVA